MAAATASISLAAPSVAAVSSLEKSSFSGAGLPSLPARRPVAARRSLVISNNVKKLNTKTPYGINGDAKFKTDAQGQKAKGKGVFQYVKKYGANVDGYSPIYDESLWSKTGSTYAGGAGGLALWAVTFGGLLLAGALLVFNTSALAN